MTTDMDMTYYNMTDGMEKERQVLKKITKIIAEFVM